MSKIQHILVATDGSEPSLKAAALAGELARALDAKVSVLLVQDERAVVAEAWSTTRGQSAAASGVGSVEAARAGMEDRAEQHELADTRSAVGDVASGVEVAQVWGHPAGEICRYADVSGVDLIVMGLMAAARSSVPFSAASVTPS